MVMRKLRIGLPRCHGRGKCMADRRWKMAKNRNQKPETRNWGNRRDAEAWSQMFSHGLAQMKHGYSRLSPLPMNPHLIGLRSEATARQALTLSPLADPDIRCRGRAGTAGGRKLYRGNMQAYARFWGAMREFFRGILTPALSALGGARESSYSSAPHSAILLWSSPSPNGF